MESFHLKNESVVAKIHKSTFLPYLLPLGAEASVEGTIHVTQAQLYFQVKDGGGLLVAVPHGSFERIRKVQGKEKSNQAYVVDVICKDLRTLRFGLPSKLQYKQLVSVLETLAYEVEIPSLFAFRWKPLEYPPWQFDAMAEYQRCGLHQGEHRLTAINKNYTICDSYPSILAVPLLATDDLLASVAQFRSRGRVPVATYLYGATGAALYRCSQPLVGLKNTRCADDELLLSIMAALPAKNPNASLHIIDARPKVAAVGNKFLGAGMEHVGPGSRYDRCTLEYMNIGNIHAMRSSLQKLCEALELDPRKMPQAIENSHWKDHISRILIGATRISNVLQSGHPVLVHCTDGWDRTAQLTCITEMMLDPYYRTIEGFAILVEKEWLSFGHKFAQRHGHGAFAPKFKDSQRAPIFLQFIDCCWQLASQFPTCFEWNERFLVVVLDACYSCIFGTFLCNTDQERAVMYGVREGTVSVWSYVLAQRNLFSNPLFQPMKDRLTPKVNPSQLQVWRTVYCRYQWNSINELVGVKVDQPGEWNVLTYNCSLNNLDRTQKELVRAAAGKNTALPGPLLQVVTKPRSHSITMDEVETRHRRKVSLEIDEEAAGSLELDVEEDEEEEDMPPEMNEQSLTAIPQLFLSVEESMAEPVGVGDSEISDLKWALDSPQPQPKTMVSPRNDASKRRGVKLDANEIFKQIPSSK